MAAVQPEPWLRALITTTTTNNNNNNSKQYNLLSYISFKILSYNYTLLPVTVKILET
jgi:hypothetical protein